MKKLLIIGFLVVGSIALVDAGVLSTLNQAFPYEPVSIEQAFPYEIVSFPYEPA